MSWIAGGLVGLSVLLWVALVVNVATFGQSDPAGRGLAEAFASITAVALWIVLAILIAVAATKGRAPGWTKVALAILVPASGAAALGALTLLSSHAVSPAKWPVVVPALAPLCLMAYALWALVPSIHAALPAATTHLVFLGSVALLSVAPLAPMLVESRAATERRTVIEAVAQQETDAKRLERIAKFEQIPSGAPLWDWLEYADSAGGLRDRALEAIGRSPRRQEDAEVMAERGYGLLTELLPQLNVAPSPAICAGVAKLLRNQLDHLPSLDSGPVPYSLFAERVERYEATIEWLRSGPCDLSAELDRLSAAALEFQDSPARVAFLARIARLKGTR